MKILKNVKLESYTNTGTGGCVQNMYYPTSVENLIDLIKNLKQQKREFHILGEMTNVTIASGTLNFDIINMSEFNVVDPVRISSNQISVSAGYKMKDLTKWTVAHSLRGLEWMEGIPGTVGAGIYMNAGFLLGQDMQSFLVKVTYLDMDTFQVKTIANNEMEFRYRYSKLQSMNVIVIEGTFLINEIPSDWKKVIRTRKMKKKVTTYHKRRLKNQPVDLPSAGTVFVPPTPWHVGGMLRQLNLVGHKIGEAQISTKSPGFIVGVNGGMTGEDYYMLVKFIQLRIKEEFDLNLTPEVRLLGFD